MFYVEVCGPLDQVYVGPFDTSVLATTHADEIKRRHGCVFDTWVMSKQDMDKAIEVYGAIPVQAPECWE